MTASFRQPTPPLAPVLLLLAGVCAALELAFTLADLPFVGLDMLRRAGIVYGGFWSGLLTDWEPMFPGQRLTMFVTYAFLHAGFLHMLFNMLLMLHLGREAVQRLGQAGFALLFAVTAAGGGAAFALLSSADAPMLGASGVVFGLFGATVYWDIQRRRALRLPIGPALRLIGGLVVMNLLLWVLVQGMLAWEAHLGGFVAGVLFARIATPSLTHRHRPRIGMR